MLRKLAVYPAPAYHPGHFRCLLLLCPLIPGGWQACSTVRSGYVSVAPLWCGTIVGASTSTPHCSCPPVHAHCAWLSPCRGCVWRLRGAVLCVPPVQLHSNPTVCGIHSEEGGKGKCCSRRGCAVARDTAADSTSMACLWPEVQDLIAVMRSHSPFAADIKVRHSPPLLPSIHPPPFRVKVASL